MASPNSLPDFSLSDFLPSSGIPTFPSSLSHFVSSFSPPASCNSSAATHSSAPFATYFSRLSSFLSLSPSQLLLQLHLSDYFTHPSSVASLLPPSWLSSLTRFNQQANSFQWLSHGYPITQSLVKQTQFHSQFPIDFPDDLLDYLEFACNSQPNRWKTQETQGNQQLLHATSKSFFIHSKKSVESESIGNCLSNLTSTHFPLFSPVYLLDFGSGRSSSSHSLVLEHNFYVIGLDSRLNNCIQAIKRMENMRKRMKKLMNQQSKEQFNHVPLQCEETQNHHWTRCTGAFFVGPSLIEVTCSPQKMIETSVKRAYLMSRAVRLWMKQQQTSKIINNLQTIKRESSDQEELNDLLPSLVDSTGNNVIIKTNTKELLKMKRKRKPNESNNHSNLYDHQSLFDSIQEELNKEFPSNSIELIEYQQFLSGNPIFYSLHACGDLSSSIIRLFVEESRSKLLFLVSCCPHALSEIQWNKEIEENQVYKHNWINQQMEREWREKRMRNHVLGVGKENEEIHKINEILIEKKNQEKKQVDECSLVALPGFPMSRWAKALRIPLGQKCRARLWKPLAPIELIPSVSSQLTWKQAEFHLLFQYYRSILQQFFSEYFSSYYYNSQYKQYFMIGSNGMKNEQQEEEEDEKNQERERKMEFAVYCRMAVEKAEKRRNKREGNGDEKRENQEDNTTSSSWSLSFAMSKFTDDDLNDYFKSYENQWKEFQAIFGLQNALAPLVEAWILLDRVIWLVEQGENPELVLGQEWKRAVETLEKSQEEQESENQIKHPIHWKSIQLLPVFDPTISPRNIALVAIKK
jgi:hypothetical protein